MHETDVVSTHLNCIDVRVIVRFGTRWSVTLYVVHKCQCFLLPPFGLLVFARFGNIKEYISARNIVQWYLSYVFMKVFLLNPISGLSSKFYFFKQVNWISYCKAVLLNINLQIIVIRQFKQGEQKQASNNKQPVVIR